LSPGPWIALFYINGVGRVGLNAIWQQVMAGRFFWTLTSLVAAGAVLGWFMARRPLADAGDSDGNVAGAIRSPVG
jgi:hypothetical protein